MSILQRIIDAIRRLFGWRPPVEPDPLPEEPEQPQEPVEPEPEPEQPTEPVEPPAPLQAVVVRSGDLSFQPGPWGQLVYDDEASSGESLVARESGDGDLTATAMVELAEGTYLLWARVFAPDLRGDRFYGGIGGNAIYRVIATQTGRYHWVHVGTYPLSEGGHRVGVGTGEVGLRLDCLVLDPTGLTPAQLDELVGIPETPKPEPEIPTPEPEIPEPPVVWGLINRSIADAEATFRNGRPITGEAKRLLNGLLWFVRNPEKHLDGGALTKQARGGDLYNLARPVRSQVQAVTTGHRLTGHPELLDFAAWILHLTKPTLRVGWRNHDASETPKTGASPYRCWPTYGGTQPPDLYGTDLSTMNEVRWHATIAEVTRALEENIGQTSPGGWDYGAEYDYWIDYLLNDFVPKWAGGGTSGWRAGYKGVRRNGGPSPRRAVEGAWPIVVNNGEMHSSIASSHLAHHMAYLTGNQQAIEEAALITRLFIEQDSAVVPSPYGPARVWPHSMRSLGSPAYQAQRVIYTPYTAADMAVGYLAGIDPLITPQVLGEMAAAMKSFLMLPGTPYLDSDRQTVMTTGDICGGAPKGGMDNRPAVGQNHITWMAKAYTSLLAWETGDTRLEDSARAIQGRSWAGGFDQPLMPFVNVALLTKEALA